MRNFARVFFVGGVISYRALFNWIRLYIYIPTMLGSPLFQIVFFTYVGRYSHAGHGDAFAAGYIAGVVHAWDLGRSARFATAVGATCVTALGATTGVRSLEETLELLTNDD